MRRREFIAGLGSTAAWPVVGRAQQPRRVGVLMNGTQRPLTESYLATFLEGLRKLGWIEGQNLRVETRWSAGDVNLIRGYAAELAQWKPDVLLAASSANLAALQRATNTVPIVFTVVSDPVAQGFVPNLVHPGGNITGFGEDESPIAAKWLELLKQMAPGLVRVGLVFNPETGPQYTVFLSAIRVAAASAAIEVVSLPVHETAEIEPAIAGFSRRPNGGLIFSTDSFLTSHAKLIVESVRQYQIPAMYTVDRYMDEGGLMYYFAVLSEQFRQAALYVDRILKGTKAGELPVQLPTKFEFIINRKTARALGIDVPLGVLLFADRVIE
jgi:putative ABC transport system substrate-binding protein